jgi:hypothetical protein
MRLVSKILVPSLICSAFLQSKLAKSAEITNDVSQTHETESTEQAVTQTSPVPSVANPEELFTEAEAAAEKEGSGWIPKGSLSLVHYYGFRGDVDPLTVAELSASWMYNGYSLGVVQSMTKYYYIYGGDSEVQAADTILKIGRKVSEPIYGFEVATTLSATLPVSQFSRDHGVRSKPGLSVSGRRSFLDKKLDYTLGIAGQYSVNRYTTTRTGLGVNGGRPLRHYSYTIDNILTYMPIEKLSLSGLIRYVRVNYHDVGFRNRVSAAGNTAWLDTNYSIDLGISYEVWEKVSVGGGYSQSDTFEKTGGVREAYLFDQYTTQWYLALSAGI